MKLVSTPSTPPVGAAVGQLFQVGTLLGKYLLTDRLGHGGAGEVFLAYHQTLNIPVAVKVLRPRDAEADQELAAQLKAEARILAHLNHSHLVRVWDYEDHPETPYLVMEYVGGSSLAELIQRSGRLRPDRALELIIQVAEGLDAAHRHNILHRDVKPGNILITKEGVAKLADLGQAVVRRFETPDSVGTAEGGAGTPLYMAPEQFDVARSIDARSDLYSLGVTFYHALTGQPPFPGTSARELMLLHSAAPVVPPHERVSDLSPRWSEVVLTMLAKDPSDRYANCKELLGALKGLQKKSAQGVPPPPQTRSVGTLATPAEVRRVPDVRETANQPRVELGAPSPASRALQEGIAAARAGKKEQARRLLLEATAFDAANENAWLWLASVAATTQECLSSAERVLSLNPNNRQALQWQEKCRAQLAKATPRKCPFCQGNGTTLEAMCGDCGAILGLQDVDLIFNTTPLAEITRIQAIAQRCETALCTKSEFITHYLLALAYLNLQDFEKAIHNFEAAARLRATDQTMARQVAALQRRWAEIQEEAACHTDEETDKGTILAIDDSPTVCKLVSSVLQQFGYRVITASGGLEGIKCLRREKVDLILLDIMMPGVDGLQLCKLIRADQVTSRIPVVFLSGKEGLFTKLWARMAGSSAYVTKPFKAEDLVQVVEKFCRR